MKNKICAIFGFSLLLLSVSSCNNKSIEPETTDLSQLNRDSICKLAEKYMDSSKIYKDKSADYILKSMELDILIMKIDLAKVK